MHFFKTLLCVALFSTSSAFSADINNDVARADGSYLVAQNVVRDDVRKDLGARRDDRGNSAAANDSNSGSNKGRVLGKTGLTQCEGEFALCAASTCKPTGKKMKVNEDGGKTSKEYDSAECQCPIITAEIAQKNGTTLTGVAAVNEGNMKGSCASPGPGKIWSYFSQNITLYPQQSATPQYKMATGNPQVCPAGSVGTNCWNFECTIDKEKTNGVRTATCTCPIGESYIGHKAPPNAGLGTEAGGYYNPATKACNMYPVSGPVPANLQTKKAIY